MDFDERFPFQAWNKKKHRKEAEISSIKEKTSTSIAPLQIRRLGALGKHHLWRIIRIGNSRNRKRRISPSSSSSASASNSFLHPCLAHSASRGRQPSTITVTTEGLGRSREREKLLLHQMIQNRVFTLEQAAHSFHLHS